jgi:pyruvate dehydrogenase E1 component beta subunit
MFCHMPGLRVVCPSSPARAYGLLLAAIREPDPVLFLEPVRIYRYARQEVVDNGEALPLDVCFVLREGTDCTIVTWGAMTVESLKAADELARQGISAESSTCHRQPHRCRYIWNRWPKSVDWSSCMKLRAT